MFNNTKNFRSTLHARTVLSTVQSSLPFDTLPGWYFNGLLLQVKKFEIR